MTSRIARWCLTATLLAGVAAAESYVWVDEEGVTHISNDPDRVPEAVRERRHDSESLRALWSGPTGPAASIGPSRTPDLSEQRTQRALRAAVEDLQRGENARAAAQLRAILRDEPGRPEPHWYLALLDRHRGRYESAQEHLEAFLATAGDDLDTWRSEARRRLAALADERRLLEGGEATDAGPWPELASPNFRVQLDPDLHAIAPDYAGSVMRYLEEARLSAVEHLGTEPAEAMGVVFYGRAAYDAAHADRFSFRTVGFFDGRIHVVSAAHPADELRALLFHEYTHAVFRDRTGGDRPYWLNEGMAELSERASRGQPGLTRSERIQLKRRIDGEEWLSLRRLTPSFGGLQDDDARVAYLVATAAAQWLEENSAPEGRARLLDRIGSGATIDEALVELLGIDMAAMDAALQAWIRSEFAGRLPRPASLEASRE